MLVYCIRVIVAVGRSPDVACCVGRVRVVVWWAARRPGVVALLRESFFASFAAYRPTVRHLGMPGHSVKSAVNYRRSYARRRWA